MFAEVMNGRIGHYRGDTLSTPIHIYDGDKVNKTQHTVLDDETVYFYVVEPHKSYENYLIKKKYTNESEKDDEGNILLKLDITDTEYLQEGQYYYLIRCITEVDGEVVKAETIVPPTSFYIVGCNYRFTNSGSL